MFRTRILITCEHAGNRVPAGLKKTLGLNERVLSGHRGYDKGALATARAFRDMTGGTLLYTDISRLVVDANRSVHNPAVLRTSGLRPGSGLGKEIVEKYYLPHRRRVERFVEDAIASGDSVLHLAVHTFTPVLRGVRRNADIGILYRPWCRAERVLAARWKARILENRSARYRVRFNYPYLGRTDGVSTALSRRLGQMKYCSLTLELSQRFFAGSRVRRPRVVRCLADSFQKALG